MDSATFSAALLSAAVTASLSAEATTLLPATATVLCPTTAAKIHVGTAATREAGANSNQHSTAFTPFPAAAETSFRSEFAGLLLEAEQQEPHQCEGQE